MKTSKKNLSPRTHLLLFKFTLLLVSIFLLFLPWAAEAQKEVMNAKSEVNLIENTTCKSTFSFEGTALVDKLEVEIFLLNELDNLRQSYSGIKTDTVISSPIGKHYTTHQLHNHYKIYNTQIKLNTNKEGGIISLFDNSISYSKVNKSPFPSEPDYSIYLPENQESYRIEFIYYLSKNELIPAVLIQIFESVENHRELIVGPEGKLILDLDLNMYKHHRPSPSLFTEDSLVWINVFLPDPLTSANSVYGGLWVDNDDKDYEELKSQIFKTQIKVKFDGNYFKLENKYVKITDHSYPSTPEAFNDIPELLYNRSEPQFENVNIYYHINSYQQYLQEMGFFNLVNYPIHADPHALNGSDQSSFSSMFDPPRISFGDGGVDDAEDADVILHEYGHAILYSAAPQTNYGAERQALDEAIGDYLAASYSKSINPYLWENVFSWDGHNEFWPGRVVNSAKTYPKDMVGSIHMKGEIWSSLIMEVNAEIGRENTDILLLSSAYNYATNMSMIDASMLLLQMDSLINKGKHIGLLSKIIKKRGLLDGTLTVQDNLNKEEPFLSNTLGFSQGINQAQIHFPYIFSGKIVLIDFTGKIVTERVASSSLKENIASEGLKSGLYILSIYPNNQKQSIVNFKLLKF